ncbi:MAG: hypothetical protein ACR2NZ_25370 [Rubripirellula sp.]
MLKTVRPFAVRQRIRTRLRNGSLVIECVIAAALIATATLALTRLARNSVALNHQADDRLAAKLTAENLLERSKSIDIDRLESQFGPLAAKMQEETDAIIDVSANPFESGEHQGVHLRIEVAAAPNAAVTLHDWRIAEKDVDSEQLTDTSTETTTEDGETDDASE